MNTTSIKKIIMDKGIQPSHHRIKIYEYLLNHHTHPTVDMIYKEISKEIPTLSRTTVYNTLSIFLEKGLISSITIDENEVRYDYNTTPHAHFKCIKCGNIYDIPLDTKLFKKKTIKGHKIIEQHIYFKGICKNCLKKMQS